jgi:hypothetical protein
MDKPALTGQARNTISAMGTWLVAFLFSIHIIFEEEGPRISGGSIEKHSTRITRVSQWA